MSRSQTLERFPDFVVQPQRHRASSTKSITSFSMGRSRGRSSNLGDIPGDTGAPAVSTLEPPKQMLLSPPLSPRMANGTVTRGTKRRKARSLLRRWRNFSFKHTWVNPLVVTCFVLLCYALNPTPSNAFHNAIFLSYPLSADSPLIPTWARDDPQMPTYYGKGLDDLKFVAFYVVVLSFTREFIMQRMLRPLARAGGIRSRRKQSRFMEQMYTAVYFSVFGPYGLYVMSRTPIGFFDTEGMYATFPHFAHEAVFKAYYLLQASYWAQQAIVLLLQLEEPRKDFKELVAHHILTLSLIGLSYRFHFTYMGVAVYVTHDISDFFLATVKSLNYVNSWLVKPYYALFIGMWIYLRHYTNLRILYSIVTTFKTIGPFELNWETQQYKCTLSQYITFSLLAALQALNLMWLAFILRAAWSTYVNDAPKDDRSDDGGTEADDAVKLNAPIAKRKGVRAAAANGSARTSALTSGTDAADKGAVEAAAPNGHAKEESARDR